MIYFLTNNIFFSLKETNQKLTEATSNAESQSSASQGQSSLYLEAKKLLNQSANEIEKLEATVKVLQVEKEFLETKNKTTEETLSKYKDETREILREAKEKYDETCK